MLTVQQQALVREHMPMAKRIAVAIWRTNGGEVEELIALAYLGLVESAGRYSYDPDITPFEVYAKPRIRGAIADAARSVDHVPRSVRRRYREGDTTVVAVVEARPVLIDETLSAVLSDGSDTEDDVLNQNVTQLVAKTISEMEPAERTVLALHYFAELELQEIARYLNVPSSRVGNLHIKAVLQVYDQLEAAVAC